MGNFVKKMKELGAGHSGIMIPKTGVTTADSLGVGTTFTLGSDRDGALYNSDGDPNLLNANRNDDGRWLNAYYDNPDNRWNRDNGFAFAVSQLSSFLSCFCRRVLFLYLPAPSSYHFTYLIYFTCQSD